METKLFDTNITPIKINGSFHLFMHHYKRANILKCETSFEYCLEMLKPQLIYWSNLIEEISLYEDFTIYSVARFLENDNRPIGNAIDKIKIYLNFNNRSDIKVIDDLMLFITEIIMSESTIKNDRNYTDSNKFLYHVAMEMKYKIFVHIRKTVQLCKRDLFFYEKALYLDLEEPAYFQNNDLYVAMNDIAHLSSWHNYLLMLICSGFSLKERASFTYLKTKELKIEEEPIWELLKQTRSSN